MDAKETQKAIAHLTEEILASMGFSPKIEIRENRSDNRGTFICSLTVPKEDSRVLIGQHGANLSALQYLIQHLARRNGLDSGLFSVDINHYWKEKRTLLEQDALEAAHKALATGRPVLLRPMVSYERKIIHTVLAKNDRVVTESSGTGEERKVIVKPTAVFE